MNVTELFKILNYVPNLPVGVSDQTSPENQGNPQHESKDSAI
jgi:hypothetical protein